MELLVLIFLLCMIFVYFARPHDRNLALAFGMIAGALALFIWLTERI